MMRRLAQFVVRRRRWVLAFWLVLAVALAPFAGRLERELEVAAKVKGSEASAVDEALRTRFASPFARFAVLVVTGAPSPDSAPGRALIGSLTAALDTLPGVTGALSYLTAGDKLFLGAGGGTFLVVGLDPTGRLDDMVPRLRERSELVKRGAAAQFPQLALRWTGDVPINYDLRQASAVDARRAEARVMPLTLVLLLIASGAIVASLLPLVAASLAIVIALGAAVVINGVWPQSVLLQNIASMIGLGVGIDYALLTVSRFREAMAAGKSAEDAAVDASEHAGVTIALSGLAVMIGFAALLFVPLNELQSTGVGGILVVGASVALATTAMPAVLAMLGNRVDAGRWPRRRAASNPMEGWWRAWGRAVVTRPWLVLALGTTPVLLLAWPALRMSAELPRGNWLPRGMESEQALVDLDAMERLGIVNELRVMLDLPQGVAVTDTTGWAATRRLSAAIARDLRVARVHSITTVVPAERPNLMLYSLAPTVVRQSLVSIDGRAAVIDVLPHDSVNFNALTNLAREIRGSGPATVSVPGATVRIGGLPAFNADYIEAINSRFVGLVLLVVGFTLVALMVGFRSILVPVKALLLNLLSVAAAYGAVVLVLQEGHGAWLFGLEEPLGAVFPAVPILVFCTVFGLSMDYEVFLVGRVAEARRTMGEADAIVEGLARTGGVITSAAAIMITVFAAFTLGDFVFIKVLGFALATAVFVDATLVRMAIGPALLTLAGKWNWWPGSRT